MFSLVVTHTQRERETHTHRKRERQRDINSVYKAGCKKPKLHFECKTKKFKYLYKFRMSKKEKFIKKNHMRTTPIDFTC